MQQGIIQSAEGEQNKRQEEGQIHSAWTESSNFYAQTSVLLVSGFGTQTGT